MSKTRLRVKSAPALRLEWRTAAELADNPANWREHPKTQMVALDELIGDVGWAGACLYNEATGRLIDGHARKQLFAGRAGEKLPVLVGRWTEAQERRILAKLDPIGAMATANKESLRALLAEIASEAPAGGQPGGSGGSCTTRIVRTKYSSSSAVLAWAIRLNMAGLTKRTASIWTATFEPTSTSATRSSRAERGMGMYQ